MICLNGRGSLELINNKIMKKAILLHWWGWNSKENWLPWLKESLEKENIKTFVPNLPNTNNPILQEQLDFLENIEYNFLVGHSLWCQLVLKFVEKNNISNSNIVLVASTYPNLAEQLGKEILWDSYDDIKKYYDTIIDFEKINKLNNKITIFLSDNDPYINMQNAKDYYSKLKNLEFVEFENKGHFNKKSGVLKLEEIWYYLK